MMLLESNVSYNELCVIFRSDTAMLYNDRAVLENHHVSAAYRLLQNDDEMNIFSNLSKDDWRWDHFYFSFCPFILCIENIKLTVRLPNSRVCLHQSVHTYTGPDSIWQVDKHFEIVLLWFRSDLASFLWKWKCKK